MHIQFHSSMLVFKWSEYYVLNDLFLFESFDSFDDFIVMFPSRLVLFFYFKEENLLISLCF